jgi:ubiquitin carboxyl-terminal hydrolase L5
MEKRKATEDDDVFHFVAYVPFQGRLYELDGLQYGPIDHGNVPSLSLTDSHNL